jgi:hypothetical protein
MARKVDEATNFAFVKLIEKEPGLYDKRHPDHARRDKMDLAWGSISREMNESGMYTYFLIKTYNRITTENKLINATVNNTLGLPLLAYESVFTSVLILHNYELQRNSTHVELLLQALRNNQPGDLSKVVTSIISAVYHLLRLK